MCCKITSGKQTFMSEATETAKKTRTETDSMGPVEVLLHMYDVADPLGMSWDPQPDVVRRVLVRLFPQAPSEGDPWQILLQVDKELYRREGVVPASASEPVPPPAT